MMLPCDKCRGTAAFREYLIRARIKGRYVSYKRNLCANCGVSAHSWRAPMVYEDGAPMEDNNGNQQWGRYVVSVKVLGKPRARSVAAAPTYKQGNQHTPVGSKDVLVVVQGLSRAELKRLLSK